MHSGYSVDKIWEMTKIDKWFLNKLKGLSDFGKKMTEYNASTITTNLLRQAKQLGFCDRQLAKFWSSNELAVRRMRVEAGIIPVVKQIDTVAAEFPSFTNYLYLTYNGSESDVTFEDHGVSLEFFFLIGPTECACLLDGPTLWMDPPRQSPWFWLLLQAFSMCFKLLHPYYR